MHFGAEARSFRGERPDASNRRSIKSQKKPKRRSQETSGEWERPEERWKDFEHEKRWKVLPAGGAERPAANITRNTVIVADISRKTPNSRRLPREISL